MLDALSFLSVYKTTFLTFLIYLAITWPTYLWLKKRPNIGYWTSYGILLLELVLVTVVYYLPEFAFNNLDFICGGEELCSNLEIDSTFTLPILLFALPWFLRKKAQKRWEILVMLAVSLVISVFKFKISFFLMFMGLKKFFENLGFM